MADDVVSESVKRFEENDGKPKLISESEIA